jgi:hypothetical protein
VALVIFLTQKSKNKQMEGQILNALLWPVRDVPRIFEISSVGFGPAMPGILELAAAVGVFSFMPKGKGWTIADVALAYGAGAAISFFMAQM